MMDRKENIPKEDRNIEDMLRPRCEFHASKELYARIISEAKKQPYRKPWYKKWKAISTTAAAVAAIIVGAVAAIYLTESPARQELAVATVSHSLDSATIREDVSVYDPETSKTVEDRKEKEITKTEKKALVKRKIRKVENVTISEDVLAAASRKAAVAPPEIGLPEYALSHSGPLPSKAETKAAQEERMALTTDDCDGYIRMVRAAYMNNIERMREEVAETKTFVQEMRVSFSMNQQ